MRAARTPPDPAPMTKRSTSRSAISATRYALNIMPALSHLGAHLADHLLGELVRPARHGTHALVRNPGLLRQQLMAERGFVEGERILELLLGEPAGVAARGFGQKLRRAGREIG